MGQTSDLRLEPPISSAITVPSRQEKETASPKWRLLGLALQGAMVVLLLANAVALTGRLDALKARGEVHAQSAEATATQVREMAAQMHSVQTELLDLRQAVSSHAREEALFLKALVLKPSLEPELARRIATLTQQECTLFGRDPNLVLAIMAVESDFNPKAVSSVGATGLMQVMPHWRKVLGMNGDLTDPAVSIRAGIQILGFYLEMYGDLTMALTAYNRGPGPVDAALRKSASPANGYEAKVLATYEKLKRLDSASRP